MIDAYASMPHYLAHMLPILRALGPDLNTLYIRGNQGMEPMSQGLPVAYGKPPRRGPRLMVASWADHRASPWRECILVEHGAGQSYDGDPRSARNPSYPGGLHRERIGFYICPNESVAQRNRRWYPQAGTAVVGSPALDALAEIPREPDAVAVSFHWPGRIVPEMGWAYPHYQGVLPWLGERFDLLGHGHPRTFKRLERTWSNLGIETVSSFAEVVRRAKVYVCDNSSTLFEAAALGIPVVVLDAPWYRREINHGLRFWSEADVGIRVCEPEELGDAIQDALSDSAEHAQRRREITALLYDGGRGTAAARAAEAIVGDTRLVGPGR